MLSSAMSRQIIGRYRWGNLPEITKYLSAHLATEYLSFSCFAKFCLLFGTVYVKTTTYKTG